jgi:hypothetical protein
MGTLPLGRIFRQKQQCLVAFSQIGPLERAEVGKIEGGARTQQRGRQLRYHLLLLRSVMRVPLALLETSIACIVC